MAQGAPNYAKKASFRNEFATQLLTEWYLIRAQRAERETRWQDAYDQWSMGYQDPLSTRNYQGRAQLQLPQIRKEVETMSRRLIKAMFPEDYLKADTTKFVDEDLCVLNTQLLRHYFDNIMNLRSKLLPWAKQLTLYGTSPMKVYWKKDVNEVYFKKRTLTSHPDGTHRPSFKKVKEMFKTYDAPAIRTWDMFDAWAYPVNATSPDEIERVYARSKVTFEFLKSLEKEGVSLPVDFLKEVGKEKDEQFEQLQTRFQAMGESGSYQGFGEGKYYDLLEVWGRAEIDGRMQNYVTYIINENPDYCIRIQQNPLWHQTPPFIFGRFLLPPGNEFYGRGLPETIMSLQHQLNDILNQGMDSTTLSLNQITVINPAYAPNAESFEIEPNAVWWADPDAVKPLTFPDLSDVYIKNASQLRAIMSELSDNTPQLPDPIAGKARSTGQAQLAINEWQTDLYSFVNQIIIESLQPMAKQVHSLLQQNVPDDDIIRIAGKYSGNWINRVVTPNDIIGNYDFHWLGAIQVENQAVKTQQMLSFLKIIPMLPQNAQININWANILIKLLRDGFNIRDVENVIDTPDMNDSIPPYIEDRIMAMGGDVEVNSRDVDQAHLIDHQQARLKEKDPYILSKFDLHMAAHVKQAQQKEQQAEMQAQQQQMMQAQQMAQIQHGTAQVGHPTKNPMQKGPINNPGGNQQQIPTDPSQIMKGIQP